MYGHGVLEAIAIGRHCQESRLVHRAQLPLHKGKMSDRNPHFGTLSGELAKLFCPS